MGSVKLPAVAPVLTHGLVLQNKEKVELNSIFWLNILGLNGTFGKSLLYVGETESEVFQRVAISDRKGSVLLVGALQHEQAGVTVA